MDMDMGIDFENSIDMIVGMRMTFKNGIHEDISIPGPN